MKESTIIMNQCESDLRGLKEDINSGLYNENAEGFIKEIERINVKMGLLRVAKEYEDEQDLVAETSNK